MRITINNFELVSGKGTDQVESFDLGGSRAVQIGRYLRAGAVKAFDRGNAELAMDFVVKRNHGSDQAAAFFLFDHLRRVPPAGTVRIEMEGSNGTILSVSAASCVIRAFNCGFIGELTRHRYQVVGGALTFGEQSTGQRITSGGLTAIVS